MADTSLDIRQSQTRTLQDQLSLTAITQMDSILASINKELTAPGRLIASSTPNLVVTIGPSTVVNPNTLQNRVLPLLNNAEINFPGGTITFPSTSGTIVVSPGTNTSITIGANQFVAVVIQLTSAGQIHLAVGTPAGSIATAGIPSVGSTNLTIGYVIVQSNGSSVIQNVTNSMIYKFADVTSTNGTLDSPLTISDTSALIGAGSIPQLRFNDSSGLVATIGYTSAVQDHFRIKTSTTILFANTGADLGGFVSSGHFSIGTTSDLGTRLGVQDSDPNTAATDGLFIGIKNSDTTPLNRSGIAFKNAATATVASIAGINVNHSSGGTATGRIVFATRNAGSFSDVLTLTELGASILSGNAAIGSALDTTAQLLVGGGTNLTGAVEFGIRLTTTFDDTGSAQALGVHLNPSIADVSYTLPLAINLNVASWTKGASATVTRAIGIFLNGQTIGATGNAIITDNTAFSGNYFINYAGSLPSTIGGSVTIGGNLSTQTASGSIAANGGIIMGQHSGSLEGVTYIQTASANPALTGLLRLATGDRIVWRNNANTTDVILSKTTGDDLSFPNNIIASAFVSIAANPASAGVLRLATGDRIVWRNNANTTDVILSKDTSDNLNFPNALNLGGGVTATSYSFVSSTATITSTATELILSSPIRLGSGGGPQLSANGSGLNLAGANLTLGTGGGPVPLYFRNGSGGNIGAAVGNLAPDHIYANIDINAPTINATTSLIAGNVTTVAANGSIAANGGIIMGQHSGSLEGVTYIETASANPATSGFIRMATGDRIVWRNNTNTTDVILSKDASDNLNFPNSAFIGGSIGVGSPVDPTTVLFVGDGTNLTGAVEFGIQVKTAFDDTGSAQALGVFVSPSIANVAFTLPLAIGYNSGSWSKGVLATVDRALGFFLNSQTIGGTGNATFADNTAFTGNWFINQSSALASTFGGPVTVVGQLIGGGTTTNDNAASDQIGYTINAVQSTFVNLTNANDYNDIVSFSVPAGDWLITGQIQATLNAAVAALLTYAVIGTHAGTNVSDAVTGDNIYQDGPPTATYDKTVPVVPRRHSFATATTVYLKARVDRTSGTPQAVGRLTAVRIR